jgi:hypothetical protein
MVLVGESIAKVYKYFEAGLFQNYIEENLRELKKIQWLRNKTDLKMRKP